MDVGEIFSKVWANSECFRGG